MFRQGDVLLIPIFIEATCRIEKGKRLSKVTLAEGEQTGHAHILEGEIEVWNVSHTVRRDGRGEFKLRPPETLTPAEIRFVEVLRQGCVLKHDEHGAIAVPPGLYEVRRQRVYEAPDRIEWVAD